MQNLVSGIKVYIVRNHKSNVNAILVQSVQSRLEALIGLLNVKSQLPSLLLAQLFCGSHLVQCYQPLDDLAAVLKLAVGHLVH